MTRLVTDLIGFLITFEQAVELHVDAGSVNTVRNVSLTGVNGVRPNAG
ncbi:MAG: hypothetical protein V3T60_14640 [Candidatus Binatia bacterium]